MLARISRWIMPTLILVVLLATYRLLLVPPAPRPWQPARHQPWVIAPRHDDPRMVTDQQLQQVLRRLQPAPAGMTTNDWVHALRLWGDKARFDDPARPSGQTLRDYFLSDDVFRQYAGADAPPLFATGPDGVTARSYDDDARHRLSGSFHTDDLLATLAETGVPLDAPLRTRQGPAQVADLLDATLAGFHLERHEFEWTLICYARYAFPRQRWENKYGQRIDCQQLVDLLLDSPLDIGPCNGLHRLEALVVLYRADEEAGGVLPPVARQRMLARMRSVSRLLTEAQTSDGYWTRGWPRGAAARQDSGQDVGERILITGHHLEWLALAPEEIQPPSETRVRAAQWLVRTLLELDSRELQARYGPFSHAARALCYWRGKEPHIVWEQRDRLRDVPHVQ